MVIDFLSEIMHKLRSCQMRKEITNLESKVNIAYIVIPDSPLVRNRSPLFWDNLDTIFEYQNVRHLIHLC